MLTPQRIEVTNVRSVTHAVLTPAPDGITALTGPIGSGKSTMLDAMAWCLYGDGVGLRQAEMRRTGSEAEPAEVTVTFTVGEDTYQATRGIRRKNSRGGTREDAFARLTVNGETVTQMTPTRLTEYVTEATGLTGRAYLGAFYIPQGQLAALTEATPAEVQALVEEQTGLGVIAKQITAAAAAAREAHQIAEALPGSPDQVKAAQDEVEAAQTAASKTWEAHEVTEETATRTQQTAVAAQDEARALEAAAAAAAQALTQQAVLTDRAERAQADADALAKTIVPTNPEAQARATATGTALTAAVRAAQVAARQASASEERAGDRAAQAERAQEALRAALGDLAAKDVTDVERQVDQARTAATEATSTKADLLSQWRQAKRVYDVLEAPDTTGCCPTCHQKVQGLDDLLIEQKATVAALEERGHDAAAALTTAEGKVTSLAKALDQMRGLASRAAHLRTEADQTTQAAQGHGGEARTARDDLAAAVAARTPDTPATTLPELVEQAEALIDESRRTLTTHEQARRDTERVEALRADVVRARQGAEEAHKTAQGAPDEPTLTKARKAAQETGDVAVKTTAEAAEARTAARVDAQRVLSAETHRDREAALWEAKATAADAADVAREAHRLLVALRKDLLAEYTATISTAATETLSMLGGEHVGFVLDETFVPRVVLADGTERPTRALSGGEKARAALCFRLGITHQITGGAGVGMLLADEITAAHDEDTRQAVVGMLADLGQPLLIVAHTDDVTQIANRVVQVSKTEDGTTLLPAGTIAA